MTDDTHPVPIEGVGDYYARYPEESRFDAGPMRLELTRTREILERELPPCPARVLDVGGAAGVYALWLAERGYEVHLVDASDRLVGIARERSAAASHPLASVEVGDARRLEHGDESADVVLLLGPLYHLPDAADRARALAEASRVLRPGGVLVAAAITRYASALDGLSRALTRDPRFVAIRDRDLRDGQHRNPTDDDAFFTTAYFHRAGDLRAEIEAAGFDAVRVLGVEGPGWILPDVEERWKDPVLRADLLGVARALEAEPSIQGASAHLLGVGRRAAATPPSTR